MDVVFWTSEDFVVVGVLLAIMSSALELAVKSGGARAMAMGIAALGVAAGYIGGGG